MISSRNGRCLSRSLPYSLTSASIWNTKAVWRTAQTLVRWPPVALSTWMLTNFMWIMALITTKDTKYRILTANWRMRWCDHFPKFLIIRLDCVLIIFLIFWGSHHSLRITALSRKLFYHSNESKIWIQENFIKIYTFWIFY